jgi:hypothetical protein
MLVGFRTYLIAVLTAVFGALAVADWNAFLADPKAGWSVIAMSVIMAVMRSITSTPPASK